MAQPWNNMDENADICQIPCDYWDGTGMHNVTIANISEPETPAHRFLNQQSLIQHNNSCKIEKDQKFIYIDGVKFYISIHPFLLGYIMILVAVVSGLIRAYTIKDLRICIESQTFWLASLDFVYLGFYVAFNTVQVISQRVVGRAEETSTYSSLGFCTVNCRPTASNYQLSHLRP